MEHSIADSILVSIGMIFGFGGALLVALEMRGRWRKAGYMQGLVAATRTAEAQLIGIKKQLSGLQAKALHQTIASMDHSTQLDKAQSDMDDLRSAMAAAYGWLWHDPRPSRHSHQARLVMLQHLNKELQAVGITAARERNAGTPPGVIVIEDAVFHVDVGEQA